MKKHRDQGPPDELDLDEAERELREGLLRLYYVKNKLRAEGGTQIPTVALEIERLERRSTEMVALWASLRRERALGAAEREVANAVLDRLRDALDERAADRTLRLELGGL